MPRTLLWILLAMLPLQAWAQDIPGRQVLPSDLIRAGQTVEWQICNETSYVVRTAHALSRPEGLTAEGWNEILPGDCITLDTPATGPRFLFAESVNIYRGRVREWKGTTPLCVDDAETFTAPATQDCRLTNRSQRDYFAVRPGEAVTTLKEPNDYSPERAAIAATQRLLRDAGYAVNRIDGISGRRTARLIRQFRQDQGLSSSVTGEPLLRALMAAARDHQSAIGVDVCNGSRATIWIALAMKEEGRWLSRGWWRAAPDECTRPLNEPLPGTETHIFALQDDGEGGDRWMRSLSTGSPAQFCIAESRFEAIGNEMCVEQGYSIATFRPVPADQDSARIRLTDSDFAAQRPGGLRR
jgi:uncharacterized membrane protein